MKKTILIAWLVMMIILAISLVSFAEEVTLRFSWWGGQDRADRTLKVIKLFEEKYPDVKIEPEFVSWDEYWQRMAVHAAGNNLPDVIQQDLSYIFQYIGKDLVLNLDPYVEDNTLNLTDVTENEILGGRFNGNLYGVNVGTNCVTYAYDPELFKKAGIEEPTPDWTWEDYIEKAKKIHDALGIYADDSYSHMMAWPTGLRFYLRQHGKEYYDKSYEKLGYEDDSLFVDYYTMFLDLVKDGVNTPPEVSLEIPLNALEEYLITKQEVAMTPTNSNQVVGLVTAAGRPLNLTVYPNAKDQVRYGLYTRPSQLWTVSKTSQYPEWGVKFVDFLTNDLEANKILLGERGVPISSKIREGLKPYLGDVQKQIVDYVALAIKYSSPVEHFFPPGHQEVIDLQETIVQKMLFGELTPEEAAKEFREKVNKILAEN